MRPHSSPGSPVRSSHRGERDGISAPQYLDDEPIYTFRDLLMFRMLVHLQDIPAQTLRTIADDLAAGQACPGEQSRRALR